MKFIKPEPLTHVIDNNNTVQPKNKAMDRIKFRTLIIAFMLAGLNSCEYHHESVLQNQTGQDIDLVIYFNKKTFEDAWGGRPYIPFIQQYVVGSGISLETFDSLNLISHYKIKNNGAFIIDHGVGGEKQEPAYEMFRIFKVFFKSDSVIIANENDFNKYFISENNSRYIWRLE